MEGKGNGRVRLLRADEIKCRVSAANEKGAVLLLYKDAQVDQKILDETFGMFGWKRSHQCMDGNLYCTVEIKDIESGEWVAKQDVGTEGNYEKEKSQASDSFKWACFNWGIGRELYTAPFIWIPASKARIKEKGGKYYCDERFSVASISYGNAREIIGLEIADGRGGMVFSWKARGACGSREEASLQAGKALSGKDTEPAGADVPQKSILPPAKQMEAAKGKQRHSGTEKPPKAAALSEKQLAALEGELRRTGVEMDAVRERYRIHSPADMTGDIYARVMEALAKTKSAEAA